MLLEATEGDESVWSDSIFEVRLIVYPLFEIINTFHLDPGRSFPVSPIGFIIQMNNQKEAGKKPKYKLISITGCYGEKATKGALY